MKLHLPKSLRLSLLSALSLATPFALTLGSTAWGGWGKTDENGVTQDADTYYLDSVTTSSISSVGSDSANYFIRTNNVADYKTATVNTLELGAGHTMNIDGSWDDDSKEFECLTLENIEVAAGESKLHVSADNVVMLNSVSGDGVLNLSVDGEVSFGPNFNSSLGTVTNNATNNNVGIINIASDFAGTFNGAISNSGVVVLQQGNSNIALNDLIDKTAGKYNPSAIANTSTGNLVIENTGNKTLSSAITIANGGTVTLKGGTFTSNGEGGESTIKTEGGTFLAFENIGVNIGGDASSNQMLDADIIVGNGATLTMTVGDRYHYTNSHTLKVLTGGSVVLGNTRQSLAAGFEVILAGGAITGEGDDAHSMALDFYDGGKITVTETGSLDANVGGHQDDGSIAFDVAANKTLTMTGDLVKTGVAKSGSGTLVLTGNTDLNSINITGGHLTFGGGDQVTHTVSGEIKSDNGSGSSTFKVAAGSTLNAGSVYNAYGMSMVVDGKLNVTGDAGLILKSNSTDTISGAGSIETTKIDFGNHSKYTFTLDSLKVGEGGIVFADQEKLSFTIDGTDVEVTGAVNAQNGAMELKKGSLVLKASEGNYFNKFNYVNGALTHTALTIKDAEFSGQTLVNTGTLTLNGVVNVITDTRNLLKGEGVYSDAENGNGFFNGDYYIIKGEEGSSLTYGDAFAVQYQGAAVGAENVNNGASDLLISLDDTSTYYVNKGTVIFAGENATTDTDKASSFYVKSGATLTIAGDVENGMSAKQVLMTTLGSGKMILNTSVSLEDNDSVQFFGNLELASGGTLTLGKSGNNRIEFGTDISSLSALNLNGGTLNMYYVAPHIKSMTVVESSENSKIYIDDVWSDKQTAKSDATRIDTLVLNSALTIETNWKSNTNIGVLSGSGDLTAKQTNTNESAKSQLWIDGLNNYSGNISLSGKMALTLNINAGQTFLASQLTVGSGSSASLIGSGVLDLGSTDRFVQGVGVGDAWSGTVKITNATASGTYLTSLGNATSKIVINGLSGWIQRETVAAHVELGTNGLTFTAYSTDGSYNFSGGISGEGDFIIDSTSNANPTIKIGSTGTSKWKGGFLVENMPASNSIRLDMVGGGELMAAGSKGIQMNSDSGTLNLNIGNSGESTTMNGSVVNAGSGTLNVTVQGDTAFKAAVDASKMTLNSGVGVTLGNGANKLTYDLGTVVAHSGGNTITLEQGATLNAFTKGSGSGAITLTGSGVYDLGNNTDQNPSLGGVTLGEGWTGVVSISGGYNVVNGNGYLTNLTNLTDLVNANSKLRFYGYSGYLSGTSTTFTPNIILENNGQINGVDYALNLANGTSSESPNITFSGSVSGSGNMLYSWKNVTNTQNATHIFAGDTSEWKGQFVRTTENGAGKDVVLKFTKGGNVFSSAQDSKGGVLDNEKSGRLHVTIDTADNNSVHTDFYGSIKDVNKLTVNTDATFHKDVDVTKVTLSRSSTFNKTLKVSDTVTVAQGESLHLGDKVSISGTSDASATMKAVEMSTSGIKGTAADSTVNSSLIELKNATSYSIENTTFTDVKLTAAQNAIIQLQNVQGDAVLSGGNYVMQAVYGSAVEQMSTDGNTTLQYQVAGQWTVDNTQTTTITLTSTPGADCGHQLGVYDLVFTLNLDFTGEAVAPTDADGWKALVTFGGQMATLLDEQQAEYAMSGTEEALALTNPYVMYDYHADTNMLIVTVTGLTVPEPTTATLSLLALAALAARRRRAVAKASA